MRTLFKGGTVITGRGPKRADVLVEGEKVRQVGRLILTPADRTVDVEGCLLFPGFIDAHTHFDLDVCNTTTADDFTTGSRAALKGGTTTVIDFACPNKGESLQHGLELWHSKADGRTYCDYGFHMTIDDWNEAIRTELPEMFRQGISSSFRAGWYGQARQIENDIIIVQMCVLIKFHRAKYHKSSEIISKSR